MQTGLLVGGGQERGLAGAGGSEGGREVKLETLRKVVLGLNLSADEVGGSPALSEDKAMGLVGIFELELARDQLVVLLAIDLEGDVRRSSSLDLKAVAGEVEVLAQQVVGGLAEILRVAAMSDVASQHMLAALDGTGRTFQDGGTG